MSAIFKIQSLPQELLDSERAAMVAKLSKLFPDGDFREIGSSAVDGVIGKQDLDYLVLAPQSLFIQYRSVLDSCFPRDHGQLSNEIYQGYRCPSSIDVTVQLTIKGGIYDVFDSFGAILRQNPLVREAYNSLKRQHDGGSMVDYRRAKSTFIESVLASASLRNGFADRGT